MTDLMNESKSHLTKTTNTVILDYLLWLSAKTILEDVENPKKGRRLIGLVDGLISSFERHSCVLYPNLLRRLNLSTLVILFHHGPSPTPPNRIHTRTNRVNRFQRDRNDSPDFKETKEGGVTLDALELFMDVSAGSYRSAYPNTTWISIAMEFILLASYGATGQDGVDAAFAYGALEEPDMGSLDLNLLFKVSTSDSDRVTFLAQWESMRAKTVARYLSSSSVDVVQFREDVGDFLTQVLREMPDPELCKYGSSGCLPETVLRAPGMISISHDADDIKRL